MNPQRTRPKPDVWKTTLICASVVILVSGLFPPWLYTFYRTGTHDGFGGRSEKSAGCYFIFTPPPPDNYYPAYGVRLDMERLLVEWVSILAAAGLVGGILWTHKPVAAVAPADDQKNAPIPFNKSDFKNDPKIDRALEIFKGQIEGETPQKLEEKPRMHHYNFAYKALPGLAFADAHVPLGFGHDTPKDSLVDFWKYVGTKLPENERVSDFGLFASDTHFGPDHVILLVTMPIPLRDTEAYFVAVIYPKSWLNNPAQENENPDLNYFILAKSEVPSSQGESGGTLRMLTKNGHGAVKFGVPIDADSFIKEIRNALLKSPQFITFVESKPWNFFMHDTETGETFGAD
jgi:hypothetical protein